MLFIYLFPQSIMVCLICKMGRILHSLIIVGLFLKDCLSYHCSGCAIVIPQHSILEF